MRRKRKPYRRDRLQHCGVLVQLDWSFYQRLEEHDLGGCWMNMTDDAASELESLHCEKETICSPANMVRAW
jgi:hypothetical protein